MARQVRFEYAGACYHVMARGDGGKKIFVDKQDHESFLHYLSAVCENHGWVIHAWVLMGNHFHLLLETPEPNLVSGMRYLMSHFSQGWNFRRKRRGHVFQGRYKAIPVSGGRAQDASYFRIVADYIHLNPARAGLAGGKQGALITYLWSSLPHYQKGKGPKWLSMERVWKAFELDTKHRGRAAYINYLEKRAHNAKGEMDEEAMRALRKGWYLGEDSFKDKLINLLETAANTMKNKRKKSSVSGEPIREHGVMQAEKIIEIMGNQWKMETVEAKLATLKKSDPMKIKLAALLRMKTTVTNEWLGKRLCMGESTSVSRMVNHYLRTTEKKKIDDEYDKITKYKD